MHSKNLAFLGLLALAQALPSGDSKKGIDKRQSFGIGGGSSEICADPTCQGKGDSKLLLPPGSEAPAPEFRADQPEAPPEFRADQPVKRQPQRGGGDDRRGGGRGGGDRGDGRGGGRGEWESDDDDDDEWRNDRGKGKGNAKGNGNGNGKGKGKGGGGGGGGPPSHVPEEPDHYPAEPHIPKPTKQDLIEAQLEYQIIKDLLRTNREPALKRALEQKLRSIEAFLRKYAGIVSIEAPPGTGTIFVPGKAKRSDDIFELLGVYTRLIVNIPRASPGAKKPSLPVYLLACQIADILVANGVKIDTTILDSWTEFSISNKAKRQDGIFRLPGTCTAEDIISLQTTLSAIQILYGRNPPFQIANLVNAVAAALQFCKVATPGVGKIIPDPYVPGGPIVPDKPVPGAPLVPEKPVPGAPLVPEKPVGGGAIVPDKPVEGGAIVPEKPIDSKFRPGKY